MSQVTFDFTQPPTEARALMLFCGLIILGISGAVLITTNTYGGEYWNVGLAATCGWLVICTIGFFPAMHRLVVPMQIRETEQGLLIANRRTMITREIPWSDVARHRSDLSRTIYAQRDRLWLWIVGERNPIRIETDRDDSTRHTTFLAMRERICAALKAREEA